MENIEITEGQTPFKGSPDHTIKGRIEPRKRSAIHSRSAIETLRREMENIKRSMVLQRTQKRTKTTIHPKPSNNSETKVTSDTSQQKGNPRIFRQRRLGEDIKFTQLAKVFRNTARGENSTDPGLFPSKSTNNMQSLQDGRHEDSHRNVETRCMADKDRYQGCIFALPPSPKRSATSRHTSDRWNSMEVQSNALWSEHCTTNLHKNHESGFEAVTNQGYPPSGVPRRPPNYLRLQGPSHREYQENISTFKEIGFPDQLPKITSNSNPTNRIPGDGSGHCEYEIKSTKAEINQSAEGISVHAWQEHVASQEVSGYNRPNGFSIQGNVPGHANDPLSSCEPLRGLDSQQLQLENNQSQIMGYLKRGTIMVGAGEHTIQRSTLQSNFNRGYHPHRCIRAWMGRCLWEHNRLRTMERGGIFHVFEYERVKSHSNGDKGIKSSGEGQEGPDPIRQYHGYLECGERGWQQQCPIHPRIENAILGDETIKLHNNNEIHSGKEQHFCRRCVQTYFQGRISCDQSSTGQDHEPMGKTLGGPIRHGGEQYSSPFLFLETGQESDSHGRICTGLEPRITPICPSPHPPDSQSSAEGDGREIEPVNPSPPQLAITSSLAMVDTLHIRPHNTTEKLDTWTTKSSSSTAETNDDSSKVDIHDKTLEKIPLIRKEYIHSRMNLEGLSTLAVTLIDEGTIKKSSSKTYQTAWNSYAKFCNDRKEQVEQASSIVNWMAHLNEKGLNQRSIRTYCVAVCSTIETATEKKVGQEKIIEIALKSLKINGNRTVKNKSMWDVQTALDHLKEWKTSNLYELSQKTAFLTALCSCWRPGSDLARIKKEAVRVLDDGSIEIQAFDVKEGDAKIIILRKFPDKRICPVETLNQYITETSSLRSEKSVKLFIKMDGQDASGDTIRRWIKEIFPIIGIDSKKFKPHSTRATSSSTLLSRGTKVKDILRLANWASIGTFKEYYLRPVVAEHLDTPTNGIQELLQSPNEVLLSNNEGTDVILPVIRMKATATTPHPSSPKALKGKKRAGDPGREKEA